MFPLRRKKEKTNNKNKPSLTNKQVFIKKRLSQTNKNLFTSVKGISRYISSSGFRQMTGSMTVEAALVLPIFLFFFLHLSGVTEMLRLHGKVAASLWNTGNQIALYGNTVFEEAEGLPDWSLSYLFVKGQMTTYLGNEYLEDSPLIYGANGLNYLRSDYMDADKCVDIVVTYRVAPPASIFPFMYHRMGSRYYARCWTGYDVSGENGTCRYVYISSQGELWHDTPDCSYIFHKVESISADKIIHVKNDDGKKYKLCEFCKDEPRKEQVYFTGMGERYHLIRNCSAIYKDVRAVEWYAGFPYRPCSRCVRLN